MKQALLLLIAVVCLAGCAPDTVFDFTTEYEGTYTGKYFAVKGYNTNSPISLDCPIEWEFRGTQFWCYFKPLEGNTALTCDFFGNFAIEDLLTLTDTTVIGQCNHSYIAIGGFSSTSRNDSLFLVKTYDDYNPALKITIALFKDVIVVEE